MDILASNAHPTADELLKRWLVSRTAPPPLIESRKPPPGQPAMHPPQPRPSDDRRPLPNGWPAWPVIAALLFVIGVLLARPGEPSQPMVLVQSPEPEARVRPPATHAQEASSTPEPAAATASEPWGEPSGPAETSAPPAAVKQTRADAQRSPPPSREQPRDRHPEERSARAPAAPTPEVGESAAKTRARPRAKQLNRGIPMHKDTMQELLRMHARGYQEVVINRGQCSEAGICIVAERFVQFADGQRILRVRVHNGSDRDFHPAAVSLEANANGTNFAELAEWATLPEGMETRVIPAERSATGAVWLLDSDHLEGRYLRLVVSEVTQGGQTIEGSRSVAVAGIQLR